MMFNSFPKYFSSRRVDFLRKVATEKDIDMFHTFSVPEQQKLLEALDKCAETELFDAWNDKMEAKVTKASFEGHRNVS